MKTTSLTSVLALVAIAFLGQACQKEYIAPCYGNQQAYQPVDNCSGYDNCNGNYDDGNSWNYNDDNNNNNGDDGSGCSDSCGPRPMKQGSKGHGTGTSAQKKGANPKAPGLQ